MKVKCPFLLSLVMLFCGIHNANAQTADNSFMISGGQFGKGMVYVFPADVETTYLGNFDPNNKGMNVHAFNTVIKSGKEQTIEMLFTIDERASGTYHFGAPPVIPPPYASGIIQVNTSDLTPPHVSALPIKGTLTVTGVGGKGQFITGSYAGTFVQYEESTPGGSSEPKIKATYQISGHFHCYRSPYE
jgi:hypothetical protein